MRWALAELCLLPGRSTVSSAPARRGAGVGSGVWLNHVSLLSPRSLPPPCLPAVKDGMDSPPGAGGQV